MAKEFDQSMLDQSHGELLDGDTPRYKSNNKKDIKPIYTVSNVASVQQQEPPSL